MNEIGGFDIRFSAWLNSGEIVYLRVNAYLNEDVPGWTIIFVQRNDTSFTIGVVDQKNQQWDFPYENYYAYNFRVVMHNTFITVSADNRWVHTFGFPFVHYPETIMVDIYGNGDITLDNLHVIELCDWREAVFFEIENTPSNAISSVIQERPVDILGKNDGSVAFFYEPTVRDEVLPIFSSGSPSGKSTVSQHRISSGSKGPVASDAIVYGYDVMTMIDKKAAKNYGFMTKVIRVPNIDSGLRKAATSILTRAADSYRYHQAIIRFLPQLEVGDIVSIFYNLPATGTAFQESFIVENMTINFPRNDMMVSGRNRIQDRIVDVMEYQVIGDVAGILTDITPTTLFEDNVFMSEGISICMAGGISPLDEITIGESVSINHLAYYINPSDDTTPGESISIGVE
jgi:hypothetical protein